jgi:hypothetical protein
MYKNRRRGVVQMMREPRWPCLSDSGSCGALGTAWEHSTMADRTDPRITRTAQALAQAIVELASQRPVSQITVADLADRAGALCNVLQPLQQPLGAAHPRALHRLGARPPPGRGAPSSRRIPCRADAPPCHRGRRRGRLPGWPVRQDEYRTRRVPAPVTSPALDGRPVWPGRPRAARGRSCLPGRIFRDRCAGRRPGLASPRPRCPWPPQPAMRRASRGGQPR